MTGLTPKQAELLAFLRKYFAEYGSCPSYEQMSIALGCDAKSNVHRYVEALEERGYISRLVGRKRSIRLLEARAGSDFFFSLSQGTRRVIDTIANAEQTSRETVMREWINERCESFRHAGEPYGVKATT